MDILRDLIKECYKFLFKEDLIQYKECPIPKPVPVPEKTTAEKLYELAFFHLGIDPTPKDEQPDEVACVHSLTTILKKMLPDFPVLTYTPVLLETLKKDKRFKEITEMKKGVIIISPTGTGNGSIVGHTGICGRDGKIMSNSSATGLWSDKFDQISWIERYSRSGKLSLRLFELV